MGMFRELLKKDFGDLMNEIVSMIIYVIDNLKKDDQIQEGINQMKAQKMKKNARAELLEREKQFKQKVADRILLKQTL